MVKKYEIGWWNMWFNSDFIKRLEMTKKLPVLNEFTKHIEGKDKDIFRNNFYSIINSLFEDLASYMLERK